MQATATKAPERDTDRPLAQALVERKVLSLDEAKSVLTQVKNAEVPTDLESFLIDSGIVEEEIVFEAKAALMNVPYIDLRNYEIDPEVLELIPPQIARGFVFFPLFRIDETLLIAMSNPKDITAVDKVTQLTQLEVSPALSSKSAIIDAIDRYYGEQENVAAEVVSNEELQDILEIIEAEEEVEDTTKSTQELERLAEDAPVVKMTNMVLTQGIAEGASDVHINPEEEMLRVRFRVDGILSDSLHLPKNLQEAVISRIKILSNLDIAEHRIPQDGQMRLRLSDGREIDIRVSTLPSAHGENVVLRILDKNAALLNLENLGFESDVYEILTGLLANAYGIVLVTGPTGSGKTTTLYAALNRLSTIEKNVITLEDPIEYRLPLIRQSQVNHKAGMTFAKGLRAILRQDPDIVMLGEIRDTETSEIAVQAALTGHLVLSTLHTNTAAGAITRLQEMGIEPFLISTAVLGVVAQRLVRRICSNCKEEVKVDQEVPMPVLQSLGLAQAPEAAKFYHGRGCKKCRDTGYKGRVSILEVLPVTEKLRATIIKGASADVINAEALNEGMRPLLYDGWIKILKGVTTVEEVMRVTNIT
ncbi:Flp pilus assembly complex ATPase component TadA [bacterium]|nr:Flp pilus assembly complex ATPase component TadA [bacterium]